MNAVAATSRTRKIQAPLPPPRVKTPSVCAIIPPSLACSATYRHALIVLNSYRFWHDFRSNVPKRSSAIFIGSSHGRGDEVGPERTLDQIKAQVGDSRHSDIQWRTLERTGDGHSRPDGLYCSISIPWGWLVETRIRRFPFSWHGWNRAFQSGNLHHLSTFQWTVPKANLVYWKSKWYSRGPSIAAPIQLPAVPYNCAVIHVP